MQYLGFDRPSFGIKTFGFGLDEFSPLELFSGSKQGVWYDPSDKSTLFQDVAGTVPVTKDGDPVALMKDKSGNGNHATQTVSSKRAIYKTDGILHWLRPDGVDDEFEFNGSYLIDSEYHVTFANTFVDNGADNILIGGLVGGTGGNLHFGYLDELILRHAHWSRDLDYTLQEFEFTTPKIFSATLDSVGKSICINGITTASDTDPSKLNNNNDTYTLFGLRSNKHFGGKFFGALITNNTLTTSDFKRVTEHLATKAGVTP